MYLLDTHVVSELCKVCSGKAETPMLPPGVAGWELKSSICRPS